LRRPFERYLAVVLTMLSLVGLAACGEQVTNVFSNVVAPGGATQSP
jgi:hypothetical protein